MRRISSIVLATLVGASGAWAADLPSKFHPGGERGAATLIYEAAEDRSHRLRLTCDRATGVITVHPELAVTGFKAGDPTAITLASRGGRSVIAARVSRDRHSRELVAAGKLSRPADLVRLLTRGARLDIDVSDAFMSVRLNRQTRAKFAQFRARCPSLR